MKEGQSTFWSQYGKAIAYVLSSIVLASATYTIGFLGIGHGVIRNLGPILTESNIAVLRTYQFVIALLALIALAQWIRTRTKPSLYLALAFGMLTITALYTHILNAASPYANELSTISRKAILSISALFPFFMFYFATSFGGQYKRSRQVVAISTTLAVITTFLMPIFPAISEPRGIFFLIYIILYSFSWVAISSYAGYILWRAGQFQVPLVRNRLRLMSVSIIVFAMRIVIVNIFRDNSPLIINLVSLIAVLLLGFGFKPPMQLRRYWRRNEQDALNRAQESLMKAQTRNEIIYDFLPTWARSLGARSVLLSTKEGDIIGRFGEQPTGKESERGLSVYNYDFGSLRIWADPYAPFFNNEERERIMATGALIDLALQRIESVELESAARENYRKIFENAVEAIFQVDTAGNILSANPAMARILGFHSVEEMIEDYRKSPGFTRFVDASKGEEVRALLRASGEVVGYEVEMIRKDGEHIWVSQNIHRFEVDGDNIIYEGTFVDITTRKRFEDQLIDSERRFKQSFDSAPIGIAMVDNDLKYIRTNKSYRDLLGYTEEQLNNLSLMDITHPEDKMRDQARAELMMRGEVDSYTSEKRYIRGDGKVVWVQLTAKAIRDEAGNLLYAMGMIQDISERKENAEELQKANKYLEALHETTLALINRLEVKELLSGILRRTGEMLDSPHGLVYIVDPINHVLRIEHATGLFDSRVGRELARGQGLAGKIWESGEPMVVNDYDTWVGRSQTVPKGKYRMLAGAPIKSNGQVIGVLEIAYREESQTFDKPKIEVLSRLAELVSVALENARLYSEASRDAQIVAISSDAIYSFDLTGKILSWNSGAEHLYGYFAEEAIGKNLTLVVPTNHVAEIDMELQSVRKGESVLNLETQRLRKDGKLVEVSINMTPISNGAGQYVGGAVIARDVTATKAAQDALIASEHALRDAQRISRIGSWSWDLSDDTMGWSDQMYEIFGVNRSEEGDITRERIEELTHPNDREVVSKQIRGSIESGQPFDFDYRIIRPDGVYVILHAQGQAVSNESGQVIALNGTVQDVTEQRLSQEITRYNEEKLRTLLEGVKDYAIFMLDPYGNITSWSSGAEKIEGYREDEVLGRHFSIFYTPEDMKRNWPAHELEVAAREGRYEEEGWRVRKDGQRFWANVIISAIRREDGRIQGFSKVVRDFTERKKLEEMKSDFISMVSHQLKTPLAIIRGYADNILLGITGEINDKQRQYLEEMREIGDRYYGLIARLLNASRLERGSVPVEIQATALGDIVETLVSRHRNRIQQKRLELTIDGLEEPIMVFADIEKTTEAISNIIDNAIKFTKQGHISILAGTDGDYGWLEVSDTGPGMSPSVVQQLFKRDQIMSGAPKAEGGSGLGLFIAKEFMNLQDGDISVESVEGQGTKFTFRLPLAKVEVESERSHG